MQTHVSMQLLQVIKVHMAMDVKISMHSRYSVANVLYREYEIAYH